MAKCIEVVLSDDLAERAARGAAAGHQTLADFLQSIIEGHLAEEPRPQSSFYELARAEWERTDLRLDTSRRLTRTQLYERRQGPSADSGQ